jgi:hypothetical protein
MKIEFERLVDIVNTTSYVNSGASTEIKFGHYLQRDFSNSEIYWRKFIVPTTNRLYGNKLDTNNREGISEDLLDIGSFHYTIFWRLIEAQEDLNFERFYTKLGTVCDLVEEFLKTVYFIKMECTNQEVNLGYKKTKEEFLAGMSQWYDDKYLSAYEYYYKYGRHNSIDIRDREYILDDYFEKNEDWKRYKTFSQGIKNYRNKIVHYYILARPHDGINWYIPKKDKIKKYSKWVDVQRALKGVNRIPDDFIDEKTQMTNDLIEMKQVLQVLWEKSISDMNELLYVQKNEILLKKYNLEFI